jgi:hypothetical protein
MLNVKPENVERESVTVAQSGRKRAVMCVSTIYKHGWASCVLVVVVAPTCLYGHFKAGLVFQELDRARQP